MIMTQRIEGEYRERKYKKEKNKTQASSLNFFFY